VLGARPPKFRSAVPHPPWPAQRSRAQSERSLPGAGNTGAATLLAPYRPARAPAPTLEVWDGKPTHRWPRPPYRNDDRGDKMPAVIGLIAIGVMVIWGMFEFLTMV
jgi:hypothetical protein